MGTIVGGDIVAAIIGAVDASRTTTVAQLHAQLASTVPQLTESGLREILAEIDTLVVVDDLVFSRTSLVAGRVFTARTDIAQLIENHEDLAPLRGAQRFLEAPRGVPIASSEMTVAVVGSIPATLDSIGNYLAVTCPADLHTSDFGSIQPDRFGVETVPSQHLAAGEIEVAALRTAIEQFVPPGQGTSTRNLVAFALSLNDQCFHAPTLPLTDLFAAAGLSVRDGQWGRAGEHWSTVSEDAHEIVIDRLIAEHQLSVDEAGDFRSVVLQWQQWTGGRATVNATSFVALLSGRVAGAFAEYWQPVGDGSIEAWMDQRRLAETLARKHADNPGVNYLRGMIDLRLGDGGAAFNFFDQAHQADEHFLPVRSELGRLLLDASRVDAAMDVLPSDVPIYGSIEYLVDRIAVSRAAEDRAGPCRCGSGKKYRSCCAKVLRFTPAEKLSFIDVRLKSYLANPPWSLQMERLADIVSTEWGLMSFPEALADPFVQDLLAVEAGGAASYLSARRKLLTEFDTEVLSTFTAQSRDAFDVDTATAAIWQLSHPDSGKRLEIGALEHEPAERDAVLVRTMELDAVLVPIGPAIHIPGSHVSLLRVMLGSRPTAEQLLGWVCRRTEILRPSIDLTAEIDLRVEPPDDVLAGID
ncbi:MAG: hypothetical protein ACR2NL_11890, partial [Acidimicrobiia bacterium]